MNEQLQQVAGKTHIPDVDIVLAAFHLLLHRYSRRSTIHTGVVADSRQKAECDGARCCSHQLVVKSEIDTTASADQYLQQVSEAHRRGDENKRCRCSPLFQRPAGKTDAAVSGIAQVLFTWRDRLVPEFPSLPKDETARVDAETAGLWIADISQYEGASDLVLDITKRKAHLACAFRYNADLFDQATVARMADHFRVLLESLLENRRRAIGKLPLLTSQERQRFLVDLNKTATAIKHDAITAWFVAQAEETPDATALVFSDGNRENNLSLTYRELNEKANQLAHYLNHRGIGSETLVGLFIGRSLEMIIGILGIMKAGGAYVPLDPSYPSQRLSYMIEHSQMAFLLTDSSSIESLPAFDGQIIVLDDAQNVNNEQGKDNIHVNSGPNSLACVIYTSSSTGQPKGVMIEHRNLCNTVVRANHQFGLDAGTRVALFASFSFVMSLGDIFSTLCSGATLFVGSREAMMPGDPLTQFLCSNRIDVICMAASSASLLVPENLPDLKNVLVAGEPCAPDVMRRWAKDRNFFIGYGMTEMTGGATTKRCSPSDKKPLLGGPNPNTSLYILDEGQQPVPVGVCGELYLEGAGLSRGYLNNAELTAARYIDNPFSDEPGARLYKSGDLARYLPNGEVEFVGRADFQINIRGHRIEPGEVENALNQHPQIARSIVSAKADRAGNTRLVGYLQPQTDSIPTAGELRDYLLERLPEYMLPAIFVPLDKLPRTPNGKLDRLSLPELTLDLLAKPRTRHSSAETEVEKIIVGVFLQVLAIDRVGINDNFFEIGADSLLLVKACDRLQNLFQANLPVIKAFEFPTIRLLGEYLEQRVDSQVVRQLTQDTADRELANVTVREPPEDSAPEAHVLVLSARDPDRLRAYAKKLSAFLRKVTAPNHTQPVSLASVAFTLQVGRKAMHERLAVVATDIPEAIDKLTAFGSSGGQTANLFTGNLNNRTPEVEPLLKDWEREEYRTAAVEKRDLNLLARLWVAGAYIEWRLLHSTGTPRRIPLPTYPFARQRHSLEPARPSLDNNPVINDVPAETETGEPSVGQLYFTSVWEKAMLDAHLDATAFQGDILLFARDAALFEAIRACAPESRTVLTTPGNTYERYADDHYAINPGEPNDYQRLLDSLAKTGHVPGHIIHFWSQEAFAPDNTERLGEQLEQGFYSMFHLGKALIHQSPQSVSKTRIIYAYRGDQTSLQPQYAALYGFANSLRLEDNRLSCKVIEVSDGISQASPLANVLLRELLSTDRHLRIRYAHEDRFVKQLDEFKPAIQSPDRLPLRQKGVYLITGGLGGLGLIFAKFLAQNYQARLVLTGRSLLSADKQAYLQQLETLGAELIYLDGDIANATDVRALVATSKERFGGIHGVIHSAGVIRRKIIREAQIEDIQATLAPKLRGTLFLDRCLESENLDFFVLFSSISAEIEGLGLPGYAFANSFLDHFAQFREQLRVRGERRGKTLAINWPLWKHGGMQPGRQTEKILSQTLGMTLLQTASGVNAFAQGLEFEHGSFMLVEGCPEQIRQALLGENSAYHHVRKACLTQPSVSPQRALPTTSHASSNAGSQALLNTVRAELVEIAARLLKQAKNNIDCCETLYAYGFDSLSLTEFASALNEQYKLALPVTPSVFFECSTIVALTDYLLRTCESELRQYHVLAEPVLAESSLAESAAADTVQMQSPRPTAPSITDGGSRVGVAEAIAIVGMNGVMPQSETLEEFWEHLIKGDNLITEIPQERWDWQAHYGDPDTESNKTNVIWGGFLKQVDAFDPLFFAISPREAELMDPQQRLFLETSWKCIEDAGYKPSELSGTKTGVFVGITNSGYRELIVRNEASIDSFVATGTAPSMIPNRISYLLNLRGPSEPIDTACSTSLVAIHRAVRSIQQGECDMAIAGGVNVILSPVNYIYLSRAGVLSTSGRCSTFDKHADGFVRSEGVAALLLKPLSRAVQDGDHVHAVIRATSMNHGGHANSITTPNTAAQAELLVDAYSKAKIDPASVSYIEAHGTGTKLGDPVEINALKKGFAELYQRWNRTPPRTRSCGIGSVKTNAGHMEAAAGMAGIIKTVLSLKHKTLPGNIHYQEMNPYINLDNSPFYIVDKTQPWTTLTDEQGTPIPRRAGISSFGFGGTNAHVVIEEFTIPATSLTEGHRDDATQAEHVFVLSAKNQDRLKEYAKVLAGYLRESHANSTTESGTTSDFQDDLRQMAADILGVSRDELGLDTRLTDYGFDFVSFPRLAETLAKRYGLHVSLDVFLVDPTIRELADDLVQTYKNILLTHYPGIASNHDGPTTVTRCSLNPADVAYTLQVGREAMPERLAVVSTWEALAEKLEQFSTGNSSSSDTYFGRVMVNREIIGLLNDQSAGSQLLDELIKTRALHKAASLWVIGIEIDWKRFYPDANRRRLALPTYPFARERFWVAGASSKDGAGHFDPAIASPSTAIGRLASELNDKPRSIPARQSLHEYVNDTIARILKLDKAVLDPDTHFESYGLDSLIIGQITAAFAKHFTQLSPTAFFTHKSINEFCAHLLEHHAEEAKAFNLTTPETFEAFAVRECRSDGVPNGFSPVDRRATAIRNAAAPPEETTGGQSLEDIAVIGISGRFPMADTIDEYWENLKAGRNCVTEIPKERWDYQKYPGVYCKWGGFLDDFDKFDAQFFNISPNRARFMTPQERVFLQAAWLCVEDAGYTRERFGDPSAGDRRGNVGVFAGVSYNEYQLNAMEEWAKGNFVPVNTQICSVANRVSYFMNLRGPSLSVDTACSASLYAVHLACESIRKNECEMAIAGGVNLSQHPAKYVTLCSIGMLSRKGRCNAFGEGGDGMVPAEAVGAVLLKPLTQAEKDGDMIYATIKGSAVNHDGKTYGYTVPNPVAQTEVIQAALNKSRIDPGTISYVETHGTGTSLGDPIEIEGLSNAFRPFTVDKQYCPVGSSKSNIGHAEAAAGIAQLIKVILQMKHRTLVPSLLDANNTLNPNIEFGNTPFYLQRQVEEWKQPVSSANGEHETLPRRAGITALGASGVNVHLIMEEYHDTRHAAQDRDEPRTRAAFIVPLSAMQPDRLKKYAETLRSYLDKAETRGQRLAIENIAYTLQVGRESFPCRAAFVTRTLEELARSLSMFSSTMASNPDAGIVYAEQANSLHGTVNDKPHDLNGPLGLAEHWVNGGSVDWEALSPTSKKPHRISLPGYPFAKQRFWITESTAPGGNVAKSDCKTTVSQLDIAPSIPSPGANEVASPEKNRSAPVSDVLLELADAPESEQKAMIAEVLQEKVGMLLGHGPHYRAPMDEGFFAMGIESMQVVGLQAEIAQAFQVQVSDTAVFDYPDIKTLSEYICNLIPFDDLIADEPRCTPSAQGVMDAQHEEIANEVSSLLSHDPIPDDIMNMTVDQLTMCLEAELLSVGV